MSDLFYLHLQHLRQRGYSPRTIDMRRRLLHRLDVELDYGLDAALPDELAAWLARPDWSVQTRANYRDHIVGYLSWAVAAGYLSWDASAGLPRPRVPHGAPRPAAEEELAQALAQLDVPWALNVRLAAYGGLRAGEISRLDREHVTERDTLVHGKGGKTRIIPTSESVWPWVRDLPGGPVARIRGGGRRTAASVSNRTAGALDRIGLGHLTLHSFRHRFGTATLRFCRNLRVVQELMGHASPATTAIYTAVTDAELRAAVDGLPAV